VSPAATGKYRTQVILHPTADRVLSATIPPLDTAPMPPESLQSRPISGRSRVPRSPTGSFRTAAQLVGRARITNLSGGIGRTSGLVTIIWPISPYCYETQQSGVEFPKTLNRQERRRETGGLPHHGFPVTRQGWQDGAI